MLKSRTKQFSISIAKLILSMRYNLVNKTYSNQLIRCSSSVGANYRAACRAKSTPDFINKLKIVEEELDESMFFLELLQEFNRDKQQEITVCWEEGNQLISIIVAALKTLRSSQHTVVNPKS